MAGELNEISEAIGQLRASVSIIDRAVVEIRRQMSIDHDDIQGKITENRRLSENRYNSNREALVSLGDKLDLHAQAVSSMGPSIAALQSARNRLVMWASVGFGTVISIGWAIEAGLKWIVVSILSHWQ